MKKILALILSVMMILACAGASAMTAGTYEAEAAGRNGSFPVTVTVSETAIESVVIGANSETAGIADAAIEKIPAAIVESQTLAVDTVTGATITSKAILDAAEKALTEAGADIEALKTPAQQEEVEGTLIELEADVVVIGAGGAGVAAAVAACDGGAKVVLVEKLSSIGGTTMTSQGLVGGYESKFTKALDVHYTFDEMYANLMNNASYRLDPKLTSVTVEKSGEIIDWMNERLAIPFKDSVLVGYGPLQMMHQVEGAGAGIKAAMEATLAATDIQVLLDTRAVEIVMDDERTVCGVICTSGKDIVAISAKSAIVTTGGYSYNPELTALLDPEKEGTMGIGFPGATGDGLIMASNVGAALTHTNDMMCVLKDYEIMAEHDGTSATANVSSFISRTNTVLLGKNGKRFVNEKDAGYMSQKLNSPVFDQMHRDGLGYVWAISDEAALAEKNVVRGLGMEFVKADTYEELAEKMGLPVENVVATLTAYAASVEAGLDSEFGRTVLAPLTAPYCAVRVTPCEIITYGGIARNMNAEVIRADGTVIDGLYTAGEASANSAYMGFTLTNAFTWGKIAGENAAEYVK